MKNLNQGLLEQIRKLKEENLEKPDIKDIDKSDDEKKSCLKNHNQNLLTQIKNDKISHLKDHGQKLLTQIKKSKYRKQCVQKLEQENQDLEKNL